MEASKIVLTDFPLRSVFQESTAPDALRESSTPDTLEESTPLSPTQIEEHDSEPQDIQTDDENLDQDSPFDRTEEEDCPNPEVILSQ